MTHLLHRLRSCLRSLLPTLLAALLLLAAAARAEFFWRTRTSSATRLLQLGGTEFYHTAVELNGSAGHLRVYAFETDYRELTRLAATCRTPDTRLIVLPAAQGRGSLALLLEGGGSGSAPRWPHGVAQLAATPTFTALCHKTGTTLVTARTSDSPLSALEAASQVLLADGWRAVPPPGGNFMLFASGRRHCMLYAARGSSGDTSITLLQREGALP